MKKVNLLTTQNESNPLVEDRYLIKDLDLPAIVMSPPIGFDAKIPNNLSMEKQTEAEREVDRGRALNQWLTLYNFFASQGLVYLAPTPQKYLQDLVFTSNLGVVLDDFDKDIVVVSNFTVPNRQGETEVGKRFFENLGFETHVAPFKFEGDAELKKIGPKLYVGGYGQRSDIKTYEWMEEKFGIKIIKVSPTNNYLYHLDVNFLPVTREDALCCLSSFSKEDIKTLEGYINLIEIPLKYAEYGGCSVVRYYDSLIAESCIQEEEPGSESWEIEMGKNRLLEDICIHLDLEPVFVNISEFYKGGADMSCLVMNLNHFSFKLDMV